MFISCKLLQTTSINERIMVKRIMNLNNDDNIHNNIELSVTLTAIEARKNIGFKVINYENILEYSYYCHKIYLYLKIFNLISSHFNGIDGDSDGNRKSNSNSDCNLLNWSYYS